MKRLFSFLCVFLAVSFYSINAYAEEANKGTSLVDTQEFVEAIKPYYIYHYHYKYNPELTLYNVRKSGIKFFEETDTRVVLGLVSSEKADIIGDTVSERIGDYDFKTSGFFYNVDNKNICGCFVYQYGELFTLAEAVEQGVVDVAYMAMIIPGTQKTYNLNEVTFSTTEPATSIPDSTEPTARIAPITEPTQPSSSKPAVTAKKDNPIKVRTKTKTVKAKKLKKKNQTTKPITIKGAQGSVTVSKVKNGTNAKIYKKITVNRKTGAITFKKGKYAKKIYKIKLKITAEGNADYNAKTVTKVVKIKVK